MAISFTHIGFPIVYASSDEYYGNQLRATSATYSPYLDSDGEKLSFRFTAQDSKDVNEVAIFITPFDTLNKRYQYTIGLQSDNSGEPSGTWMNNNNVSWVGGDREWRWFTLSNSVSLTNGTVYHLVVEALDANSSDCICFRGTHPKTSIRSNDNFIPTHSVHDPQLRQIYYNGASWSVQSRTVCFLIKYTDGKMLGLPYDMIDINAKVYGGATQCQVIDPEEDIAINTLGFWVRKLGNPSTLNITLEQPKGTVHRFVVIDPSDVSSIYSWKQGSIQPFVLRKGETYYLCAKSPSSDAYNYYELRHPSVDVDCGIDILNSTWGDTKSKENNNEYHDLTFRMNITTMPFAPADGDGGVGTDTMTVTVDNVAPTVDAGPDQTSNEGDPVICSGSFADPGADNHTIVWDFGDGASDSGTLTPSHVYADNGVYTVTLTVTDGDGGVGTDTMTATVDNVAPVANAGESQEEYSLEMVSFSGDFYDPGTDTQTFEWDFGDESGASGTLSPTHVYIKGGEYTITLTVADDDGGVGTDTMTLTVISSLSVKKDALTELKAISGLYEKKVDNKIKSAITHIEKSLDLDLWFDDDHLDAKHGHKVFDEERKAVKELMRLLDMKETPSEIVEIIQRTILKLVEADQKLANTVYTEALRDTGDKKVDHELEKASQELLKAEEELSRVDKKGIADPRYDKAIDHYKKAWEHCQSAVEHASK
jgi:PKD repeat protein